MEGKLEQLKKVWRVFILKKINTFVSVFPTTEPKYVLAVMLDEPKTSKDYIYHYRDGSNINIKALHLIQLDGQLLKLLVKL